MRAGRCLEISGPTWGLTPVGSVARSFPGAPVRCPAAIARGSVPTVTRLQASDDFAGTELVVSLVSPYVVINKLRSPVAIRLPDDRAESDRMAAPPLRVVRCPTVVPSAWSLALGGWLFGLFLAVRLQPLASLVVRRFRAAGILRITARSSWMTWRRSAFAAPRGVD